MITLYRWKFIHIKYHIYCRRLTRGGLAIPSAEVSSMVTTASRMFDQHHGKHLKREGVVRGLVAKILGRHPEFDKKVITKIIRVRTFARPLIDFKIKRKSLLLIYLKDYYFRGYIKELFNATLTAYSIGSQQNNISVPNAK